MRAETSDRPSGRKPRAALVLGIVGLATGFLVVTLLCAVLAVITASLAFQEMWDGRASRERHGSAVAGLVCGIVAMGLWVPVLVAVGVTQA